MAKTHKAILWDKLDGNKVKCRLCPHGCELKPGRTGICLGRRNDGGELLSTCYYDVCSAAVDPVEKKPLFHFMPGSKVMSIATPGCNLQCDFCQNWQISRPNLDTLPLGRGHTLNPEQVVNSAESNRCTAIAYTYTEPTIYMELAADCGKLAHESGLKNIFVSNGFMTAEAAEYAAGFVDGANIDLKSITNSFYKTYCKASIGPVLETLKYFAKSEGIWLEVTTLVIPGLNDSRAELTEIAEFIANDLGVDVPWHISRFHPCYLCTDRGATDIETLKKAYQIANDVGLRYAYVGNLPGSGMESSYCPDCGQVVIGRKGYQLDQYNILSGACMGCGAKIEGIFENFT